MGGNEFLSVEASTPVSYVVELLADQPLNEVVVHDEEEDDFYLVPAEDIVAAARGGSETMGGLLSGMALDPIDTIDVGPVAEAAIPLARRAATDAIVLAEGAVVEVPGRTVRGGGGGGDPEAAADGGSPLAVAVDYPDTVPVGETISLLIGLTGDVRSGDTIPFVAVQGDEIDVVVSPKSGFVVVGRAEGRLVVGDADPLPFQVRVRATALGLSRVVVYAFRDQEPLGSLTIAPEVVAAGPAEPATPSTATTGLTAQGRSDADLELIIFEEEAAGRSRELKFRLSSRDPSLGLNLQLFGPITLDAGPGAYFTDLYKQIEKLPLRTEAEREAAAERLHAMGSDLFATLLPADLQTLLWRLRERIGTVWVQSDEPWVPWELCRLQGRENGRIVEGPFFCEAFQLTRWMPGIARLPEVRLSQIGLIVPPGSGLTSAQAESAMVHGLAASRRKVRDIPPNYVGVRQAMATGTFEAIHFAGHGAFPDQSNPAKAEIELDGGQSLRPTDISGVTANLGLARPIVFLNACQAGRQSRGLTGVGGWATAMLRAGASAFVGAHWEVSDDLACRFASKFYERLLGGDAIASAAREARLEIRDGGDPTWLAYTVFADPGAKLVGA